MTMVPDSFNAAQYFVDRHVADGHGAKVAIECGDRHVTYAQLAERINRLGNTLRDTFDVRIEERVVLLLLDVPEFAYSFFGVMKIGAVAVPVNTLWKPADYEYVLNDARARVLIVSAELLPRIAEIPKARLQYLRHIVVVGPHESDAHTFDDVLARGGVTLDAANTSKDDAAFWNYSSGSTGAPKGCVHRHQDMVVTSDCYAQGILGMRAEDRCFSVAKLFFVYGLGNALYFPLSVGATTILFSGAPTAANVYAAIEAHRPTLFFSVPTGYAMMLAHQRPDGVRDFDLSSVRQAISAGEALPPALFDRFKQRFGIDILDGIGSTETLHMFITNRPDAIRPGSSGLVIPGYEARLVDEQNNAVARGEIGNLLIKGDSICTAYWNKFEKTRQTIEGQWIRTGDKYYEDEDGYFWHAGRSDDMLKVGGQWVSPVDVENALLEHPSVLECAVVGREDGDALVKPEAYVVLHADVRGDQSLANELQHFVRTRLAEYKRPRWIQFVDTLPRTATGKLQRFKLRS